MGVVNITVIYLKLGSAGGKYSITSSTWRVFA